MRQNIEGCAFRYENVTEDCSVTVLFELFMPSFPPRSIILLMGLLRSVVIHRGTVMDVDIKQYHFLYVGCFLPTFQDQIK